MKKILIAEDNSDFREIFAETVGAVFKDAKIWSAVNGKDALLLYTFWEPDLVITDLMMPKMRGDELAFRIRERESTNVPATRVPIILVSSEPEKCENKEMFTTIVDKCALGKFKNILEGLKI